MKTYRGIIAAMSVVIVATILAVGVLLAFVWTIPSVVVSLIAAAVVIVTAFKRMPMPAQLDVFHTSLFHRLLMIAACFMMLMGVEDVIASMRDAGVPSMTSSGLGVQAILGFALAALAFIPIAIVRMSYFDKAAKPICQKPAKA
ncbi:hypothetical protein D2E26_1140 [Bifidobacterium dolichotidis]|uniref:Uncharacterized protein n=1 Tax=Bifidobacterium dolichotidis TaxID=2306976 RepID=A0A430FQJ9_9BIFI|nr:hypothetical protein [Bifidobacterium dolichotidis]RSX55086.1 hypothetical protein D2E26_1140 [Bifidobacterium dolichotidis]